MGLQKRRGQDSHADPQGLVRVIGPLFRRIWEECVFPEEWGLSDVSHIPKEGKARPLIL